MNTIHPSINLPPTEQRNPLSNRLDQLSTISLVALMNQLDAQVPQVIAGVLPQIAEVIDQITAALSAGGRLFYQGAGTSGRLAVLDAAELIPTFSAPPDLVIGLLAGGPEAMVHSIEGAEDDEALGQQDLIDHQFSTQDMVIGIAASGRTPYVLGGLRYAAELGAKSAAIVCNPNSPMAAAAPIAIEIITGPELLTGSTRLKAGSAQKMVLNMLSTCAMVKLGKVYENLMVDVQPTNSKLRQRATRIVAEITGLEPAVAHELLQQANWQTKTAVVMGLANVNVAEATARLHASGGRVREALS
ncbi:MAG: N-acetylmuramic acid 6-phosphate etherase [Caldilineaceae bacterium]